MWYGDTLSAGRIGWQSFQETAAMAGNVTQLYNKKIVVAMSGGVDSAVTAALLKEAGAEVCGVFMRLAQPDVRHREEEARAVADHLGIPLMVEDLHEEFARQVLNYFAAHYCAGSTPNPCVICNRSIKCGSLLARVVPRYGELLATGHYARIEPDDSGVYRLRQGVDQKKDQSYFLCRLDQPRLRQMLFPLGGVTKESVYGMAAHLGIAGRHGKESQDVCFLKEQSVAAFLEEHYPVPGGGPIITRQGEVLGRHQGLHHYTVGQRRGLGLPDATPFYVTGFDAPRNAVIVGKSADLLHCALIVAEVHWLGGVAPPLPRRFQVKIRYRHLAAPALVEEATPGTIRLRFDEPQRAATPGQFAVLYDGEEVAGSGVIVSAEA